MTYSRHHGEVKHSSDPDEDHTPHSDLLDLVVIVSLGLGSVVLLLGDSDSPTNEVVSDA